MALAASTSSASCGWALIRAVAARFLTYDPVRTTSMATARSEGSIVRASLTGGVPWPFGLEFAGLMQQQPHRVEWIERLRSAFLRKHGCRSRMRRHSVRHDTWWSADSGLLPSISPTESNPVVVS